MLRHRPFWPLLCSIAGTTSMAAQTPDIGPPPGRLVDVGGRSLHVICSGSGAPTVLLEAGASAFAIDFFLVQPEIARTNRVCAYDRAGMGWSSARPDLETPARIVADLEALLTAIGEKPPFVLVGASFGAVYVRLYQLEHPAAVAGLVLLDPATEDRLFTMYEGQAVPIASLTAAQFSTTLPAAGSVPVRSRPPQTGSPFDRLPPDLYQLRVKLDQRLIASMPASVTAETVRETAEGRRAGLARLLESRALPDAPIRSRPLVVLTRGLDVTDGLTENHAGLAKLSDNARHTVVADAGHEIHLFSPAAVIQAVSDVVAAAGRNSRLPARP